jgi:hypothetical protein
MDLMTWFAIFGMVMAGCMVLAAAGWALLVAGVLVATRVPRLHFGRPKNPVEWRCYSSSEIVAAGRGRLIQQLELQSWLAISSRNTARWTFGLMRWRNVSSGL